MPPLPQQILELAYWLPLVALVLVSLGLVALKWMPSVPLWAERLISCPFYLISFPVVTLLMGAEIFLSVVHLLVSWFFGVAPSQWLDVITILVLGNLLMWTKDTLVVLASGGMVCVALVGSIHVLRRELWGADHEGGVTNRSKPWLMGVALAIAFFWTWLSLRYVIVNNESTRFVHLRIV
jgi:hypothetical protein